MNKNFGNAKRNVEHQLHEKYSLVVAYMENAQQRKRLHEEMKQSYERIEQLKKEKKVVEELFANFAELSQTASSTNEKNLTDSKTRNHLKISYPANDNQDTQLMVKSIEYILNKICSIDVISNSEILTETELGYRTPGTECNLVSDSINDDSENTFSEVFENIKSHPHQFKIRKSVLGESCYVCQIRIRCGRHALKCTNCHAPVHMECHQELARPCISAKNIINPGANNLEEFCSSFKLMIPGIVFHSILYVENNLQSGLYSASVCDKKITRLKELLFRGRGIPNLNKYDVRSVCAFLKAFFASLSPPLISEIYAKKLLINIEKYGAKSDRDGVIDDYMEMSKPNRDTLSFLIIHLQKIANTAKCNMSSHSLSEIFAPILIENFESENAEKQNFKRKIFFECIHTSENIWKQILLNGL